MKTALTALFIFSCFLTFSQRSVNKGKIYFSDKTLDGYISILSSEATPQGFLFSDKPNGNFIPASGNITRVEFDNGLIYEPFMIKISVLTNDYLTRRLVDYEKNIFKGVRFLQNLVSGNFSLYLLRDEYGFQHFFYKAGYQKEVTYLQNNSYVDEQGMFFQDNAYRNQIGFLFKTQNCSVNESRINNVPYDITSLPALFKRLNACGGGNSTDNFKKQSKSLFLPGIIAGMMAKRVEPDHNSPGWQRQIVPAAGVYFLFEPGQGRKGMGFGADVVFNSFKSESGYRTATTSYAGFKGFYEYTGLELTPFLRFYMSGTKVRTYISAGANISLALNSSYYLKDAGNTTYQFKSDNKNFCPVGALGTTWKRFCGELNIGTSLGLLSGANYYGLLLRYSILK
jgi:hypothetical protein